MCLGFGHRKRATSDDYQQSIPIHQPLEESDDGLPGAFQSLSIHSSRAKTPVSTQAVALPSFLRRESAPSITPSSTAGGPKIPAFPRFSPPQCRRCSWIPKKRETVLNKNPNGNAGRPYYICIKCKNVPSASSPQQHYHPSSAKISQWRSKREKEGWIAWDDNIGIASTNRPCYCGFVCRQDRAGVDSGYPGGGFWTCAVGVCGFLSFRRDALTEMEARKRGLPADEMFEPWLLRSLN